MEMISNCTADAILNAAKALKDGRLVAFPTETVYGLGADATNEKAVSRIYSVKGRPSDHPLIVHISSINKLDQWATDIPDYAIKLARGFWPGPMTLILPRQKIAKDFITGGQNNVGLRVPDQPIALALLRKFEELGGQGIAAPSANRFGAVSPTTSLAVEEELSDYLDPTDLILDGGPCSAGIESTIIDCTSSKPAVLRPGIIQISSIERLLKIKLGEHKSLSLIKTSGMLIKHYSPKARIAINVPVKPGDGLIALKDIETPENVIRLAKPDNAAEYSKVLYESLRNADRLKIKRVVAIFPLNSELFTAIEDRLNRAAY